MKRVVLVTLFILIALLIAGLVLNALFNLSQTKNQFTSYTLTPADEDPALIASCSTLRPPIVSSGSVVLFLGNSLDIVGNDPYNSIVFPYTLIDYQGTSVITVEKNTAGDLVLSSTSVWDSHGTVVGTILNNTFTRTSGTVAFVDQPDKSTLSVLDQYGNQILYWHYSNSSTMELLGSFYNTPALGVVVQENKQYIGNVTYSEDCSRNSQIHIGD